MYTSKRDKGLRVVLSTVVVTGVLAGAGELTGASEVAFEDTRGGLVVSLSGSVGYFDEKRHLLLARYRSLSDCRFFSLFSRLYRPIRSNVSKSSSPRTCA